MSRVLRPTIALGAAAIMGLALSACSSMPFNNRTQSTELAVGQCLLVPLNSQVNSVATTECTEAHTGEVYSVTTLKNDTMPSRDEMDELVHNTCYETFEAYVGTSPEETTLDYTDSSLEVTAMYPTEQTWAKGDREIVCIAVRTDDEQLTASVRDSGL